MNKGDDVTLNARIVCVFPDGDLCVKLKSGQAVNVKPTDINTVRPMIKVSEIDHRKGN